LLQEPAIANAMLKQGVLNSQVCQDFSVNKELKSFRVRICEMAVLKDKKKQHLFK
jgi:hypothetical protein